ncbi:hypothetical protein ACFL1D_04295 [Candidatus Omnitrophota bacterium]
MYRRNNNKAETETNLNLLFILFFACCLLGRVAFAEDQISYDDAGRRDPFMALVTPDGRLINLEPVGDEEKVLLGGIIYEEDGNSFAIINGEVVSAGDYVLGYSVLRIDKNKVIMVKDGKETEYILEKEEP